MVRTAAPAAFSDHAVLNFRLEFFSSSTSHLWLLHFLLPILVLCCLWQRAAPLLGQWSSLYSSHPTQPYLLHFQPLAPFLRWCCCSLGFLCLFWSLESWTRHQVGFARAVALLGDPLHAPLTHGPQSQGTVLQAHSNSRVGTALFQLFSLIPPPTPTFREILHPVVQPVLSIPKNLPLQPIAVQWAMIIFSGHSAHAVAASSLFSVLSAPNASLHQTIDIKTY